MSVHVHGEICEHIFCRKLKGLLSLFPINSDFLIIVKTKRFDVLPNIALSNVSDVVPLPNVRALSSTLVKSNCIMPPLTRAR
jgi:hypothetical protein